MVSLSIKRYYTKLKLDIDFCIGFFYTLAEEKIA